MNFKNWWHKVVQCRALCFSGKSFFVHSENPYNTATHYVCDQGSSEWPYRPSKRWFLYYFNAYFSFAHSYSKRFQCPAWACIPCIHPSGCAQTSHVNTYYVLLYIFFSLHASRYLFQIKHLEIFCGAVCVIFLYFLY